MVSILSRHIVVLFLFLFISGCGSRGEVGLSDPRAALESMGPVTAPVSDELEGKYDSVIGAIIPSEDNSVPGMVVRTWKYRGEIVQIESVCTKKWNPIPALDIQNIDKISYGTGPSVLPAYGAVERNGVVVRPGRESRTDDPDFTIADIHEITAVIECLRSKSTRTTKVVARRALQLSSGKIIDGIINEDDEDRVWSGDPGFRIYQKGGDYLLIPGLLSLGEFRGFSNNGIRSLMLEIAAHHGIPADSVFKSY